MPTNRKRVVVPTSMGAGGYEVLKTRDDVEVVPFAATISSPDFNALLTADGEVNGAILGLTRFGETEANNANGLQVVSRIGVGYDTVDVPALTRHKVPLMIAGTANSPSVAEQAMHFMFALAKRGAELNALVKANRWADRFKTLPIDLINKTLLIVGFGRIGTRVAKRCLAMEMAVLVYDPYVNAAAIRAAGCEPVADLDAALPRADFVTIHCPKTDETVGMFDAARLRRMKPTVDEKDLHAALTAGVIAAAGIDVLDREPPDPDNPLLKLANIITAPHMAGVTVESIDRMAVQAVRNVLSVFDGAPIVENVINPEVL
jgi:D-3-phosphoglycerate dehydrogenase